MILKFLLALIPSILRPSGVKMSLKVPFLVGHDKTKWSVFLTATLALLASYNIVIPDAYVQLIIAIGGVLAMLYGKSTLPFNKR